ncbi:DNA-directed RNA polymerase III subunit RPC6 [Sphaerodactylus townsendi]|uniref:DNA-directed RNA polymerase III subunit RPC6 n=1 Tax=Sphaerodactylus townsendi TaxID=933632 RepID=UPI0020265BA2|nr:DNA-directed RNA polymerase III subunit RPC6 [Sphaerodactylus townsendi]
MAEPKAPEPLEIESRIIELCHQFPHGITDQVIQNDMPHMEAQQRAMAINRLLSMGQLDLLRSSTGLLYRIKESQNAGKMKGSDNQEKLVYQIIEDAGNKGIRIRSLSLLPVPGGPLTCALNFDESIFVFDDCHEGGEISPSNCIYMTEWLEF